VLRDIRVAGKAPEYSPLPISATWFGAMLSHGELGSRRRIRIMSPNMVNEL